MVGDTGRRVVHGRLNTVGAFPAEDKSNQATIIPAAREQVCAAVTPWQLIAFARSEVLEVERAGQVMVGHKACRPSRAAAMAAVGSRDGRVAELVPLAKDGLAGI